MKKIVAFIFILLANMVLLAHAVLPHHHHGEQICINLYHHHDSNCDSGTYPADCRHDHGAGTPLSNCYLKQLVVVPAGQSRVEPAISYLENFSDCLILQPSSQREIPFIHLFRVHPYPKDIPLLHPFLDFAKPLRAPPAV